MTRISKLTSAVAPEVKSIERQAHEAWVRYFNGHTMLLRSSADSFVPRHSIITQGSVGCGIRLQKTTFDDVRREMQSALYFYQQGNKKQCKEILGALSRLNPDFDVRMTFFKMLAEAK